MDVDLKKTIRHSGGYFVTQVATKLIGIVSFPIITRLLSVQDYGLLSLANTTLLFLYALGKCGVPKALIIMLTEGEGEQKETSSSAMFAVSLVTVGVCALYWFLVSIVALNSVVASVFYVLPVMVFFRNQFAVYQARLRAMGQILRHNILSACFETGSTLSALLVLYLVAPTVFALFGAKVVFEFLWVGILLGGFLFSIKSSWQRVDFGVVKKLLLFGAPLVWLELSVISMTFGDRFQIGYLMNSEAVGLYSAAYNLARYVQQIISQPLVLAVFPLYTKLYAEKGEKDTSQFLGTVLNAYFALSIPLLVFVSGSSELILSTLASDKYSSAAAIIPVVFLANILNGCIPLLSAGLYVSKRTKIIGLITVCTALLNFSLNWIFISLWGYMGAALSTLISFFVLCALLKYKANDSLRIVIRLGACGKYLLMALCAIAPNLILEGSGVQGLLLHAVWFCVIYCSLLLTFDREIYGYTTQSIKKILKK